MQAATVLGFAALQYVSLRSLLRSLPRPPAATA
jgi:hypothetical protein